MSRYRPILGTVKRQLEPPLTEHCAFTPETARAKSFFFVETSREHADGQMPMGPYPRPLTSQPEGASQPEMFPCGIRLQSVGFRPSACSEKTNSKKQTQKNKDAPLGRKGTGGGARRLPRRRVVEVEARVFYEPHLHRRLVVAAGGHICLGVLHLVPVNILVIGTVVVTFEWAVQYRTRLIKIEGG